MDESGPGGVFIDRGMQLRIPEITLSIGPDGQPQLSTVTPELAYDLWPLWLRIAIDHQHMARAARTRLEAITGTHDARHGRALQDETTAGMVSISAAMFAIDAFYGAVLARIDVPPPKGKRSQRYAIIAETLKRAFTMTQKSSNAIRNRLQEAFRIRDMSVHPTGQFRQPMLHPVMHVGVAMPHVAFRVENAEAAVHMAISLIEQCSKVPKARHKDLVRWCEGIPGTIEELKQLRNAEPESQASVSDPP